MSNVNFTVKEMDTNYSEIPTGWIEAESFEDWCGKWDLEIVERDEKSATIRGEWGNSEGSDTFKVEF